MEARSSKTKMPKPPTPADFRAQATLWAQKALKLAQSITPPDRTEECDIGCVVVTHNLGELAEMAGDVAKASKLYLEAEGLAKGLGFEQGIGQAQEALKRINKDTEQKLR